MASSTLLCPCCLRFKFSPEEIEQRYRSQEIDKMLDKDKHYYRRQVKLLLLGAGESGKSTFLKQMRIIHGVHFEPELIKEYQHVIYQNIVKGMKVLVDARNKLNIPWENVANSECGEFVLKFENSMVLDTRLFLAYAPSLYCLWKDASIRRAFERRREFQLSDSVQYFFENLERIARMVSLRTYTDFLIVSILLMERALSLSRRVTIFNPFCPKYQLQSPHQSAYIS